MTQQLWQSVIATHSKQPKVTVKTRPVSFVHILPVCHPFSLTHWRWQIYGNSVFVLKHDRSGPSDLMLFISPFTIRSILGSLSHKLGDLRHSTLICLQINPFRNFGTKPLYRSMCHSLIKFNATKTPWRWQRQTLIEELSNSFVSGPWSVITCILLSSTKISCRCKIENCQRESVFWRWSCTGWCRGEACMMPAVVWNINV